MRAGRRRAFAALLTTSALTASVAHAQTAWFSLQGDFNTPGDQQNVLFSTSSNISSPTLFQSVTHAHSGGTNFAGDAVAPGGIDSVLRMLRNGTTSVGFNDDKSATGRDSIVTWSPTTPTNATSSPLASPFSSGAYTLNLRESGNDAAGRWAVDLVGPASVVKLNEFSSFGTSSVVRSLKFGADSGGTATFNHMTGSLTLQEALVVGQGGKAALNLSGGTITNAGVTTVNAGSTLTLNGGVLNSNGDFNAVGGTVNFPSSSALNLAPGATFTASANAVVNISSIYTVTADRTFNILGGAHVLSSAFNVDDTLNVSGAGSIVFGAGGGRWGGASGIFAGGPASVTIEDGGLADMRGLVHIGQTAGATVLVQSSGQLSTALGVTGTRSLNISTENHPAGIATLTITGAGSSVTSPEFRVGSASAGSGVVHIQPGGTLNVGSFGGTLFFGSVAVSKTGTVNLAGGTLNASNLSLFGGKFHASSGAFNRAEFMDRITVSDGGLFDWNMDAGFTFPTQKSLQVTGAGSVFRQTDPAGDSSFLVNGGSVVIENGGKLEVEYLDVAHGSFVMSTGAVLDATHGQTPGMNHRVGGDSGVVTMSLGATTASLVTSPPSTLSIGHGTSSNASVSVVAGSSLTVQELNLAGAGTGKLAVGGTNSVVTQVGNFATTIGRTSSGTVSEIEVTSGGTFSSGTGAITVTQFGLIDIAGGTFNANADVNLSGGDLVRTSGTFNLAPGKTLTATGSTALFRYNTTYRIDDGTTFDFNNRAVLDCSALDVGTNGTLTLASNARLSASFFSASTWGDAGGTASVTLSTDATASLRGLNIAAGSTPGTNATVLVQSGADVSANGDVTIANSGPVGGGGSLTVTGAGSTFVHVGATPFTIGHASDGTATLDVLSGGLVETGANSMTTINATGVVNVDNATLKINGSLQINAGGALTSAGASTLTANAVVNDGTLTVGGGSATAASISGSGITTVTDGGTLTVTGGVKQASLSIGNGASVVIPPATPSTYAPPTTVPSGSDATGSKISSLSISGTGVLDLGNSDLAIDYTGTSPLDTVRNLLATGGITSAAALSIDPDVFALGYAENADLPSPYGTGANSFFGTDVDGTSVLIKFTWLGDLDLDGFVDFSDLSVFNTNYDNGASGGRYWSQGDFNYDGFIDFQDLSLFNTNYDPSKPSLPEPGAVAAIAFLTCFLRKPNRRPKILV